ncbi:hypothetical protein GRI75_14295 [Altererythrobacter soli]|uniref:Uncharacterized protein n=1 Tax=Croceibacterium soli TaxID=1739690 RepID=A0A6I4UYW7_9SPHN|nr:hypothetical protein [Croceibacterium soli]MXP42813.1 hypothetical protein [Croceibacterium soli]
MRLVLALLAPLATAATSPEQGAPPPGAEEREPTENCRGRIERVRQERGLPQLRRDSASPEEPLLIAAVDKRIDGCAVLVMRHDAGDIRPLPPFQDGPARRMPAR